ncbi:hypothetical protein IMX26_15550 [Clostridium sp. 'deep sea']|uniref:hypothetical protein n=1 Tax=Clostridium sp. 'deep sea' TaxID=2779445 RepID=UPI001896955E|nr:hypothetical protein [Clostridium sp. 'deep sea']QOR34856.1 hypothetical protein IMX26_15550 [Clostridium sp. 'deep sea']
MFLNCDFMFLITSLIAISFILAYMFVNIGCFNKLKIAVISFIKPVNIVKYVILNNLYIVNYNSYNKYYIWRYCVEF